MPSVAQLRAEIDALKAQIKAQGPAFSLKVSEKGAVSVYGLQRFPVTLYAQQWAKVIEHAPEIDAFIRENMPRLALKK